MADIIKSITVYTLNENSKGDLEVIVVCRDPRGQWCLDMHQIDDMQYLISDFKSNLVLLTKNTQTKLFQVRSILSIDLAFWFCESKATDQLHIG